MRKKIMPINFLQCTNNPTEFEMQRIEFDMNETENKWNQHSYIAKSYLVEKKTISHELKNQEML